tara:strand:- start:3249 stop:4490 length:1242 start_codon:yes stop_codon:yes gene_type:complete
MSLDPQYIIPYLKQIPLFASLNDDECLDIVRTFGMENKRQGELLCMEGAVSEGMFILQSGKVEVEKKTVQGTPEILCTLGTQDVVGEMALLDGRTCSATVRAVEDVSYYKIDKNQFMVLRANLKPAPFKVIRFLAQTLVERLRQMNGKIENFYANPKESLREMKKRKDAIMEEWRRRQEEGTAQPRMTRAPQRPSNLPAPVIKKVKPLAAADVGDDDKLISFLTQVPLLEELTEIELEVLAGVMSPKMFRPDNVICKEKAEADSFFVIADGQVAIVKDIAGGEEQVLAELGPGALIGEMSLIDGKPRSATIRAIGGCTLLEVKKEEFESLYRANSPFALRFTERIAIDLSMRLRSADERFLEIFSRTGETMDELKRRFIAIQATIQGGDELDTASLLSMVGYKKVPTGGPVGG